MNTSSPPGRTGLRERFQWGSYGFVPGLLIGILLGWIFSGVVSWVVRFGFALLILIPIVLIFLAWRWFTTRDSQLTVVQYQYPPPPGYRPDSIEANAYPPQPGYRPDPIEANARVIETRVGDAER